MVVTGDLSQVDLPLGTRSGLTDALEALDGIDGVSMVRFTDQDMVRHPLVTRVVRAYEQAERRRDPGSAAATPAPTKVKAKAASPGKRVRARPRAAKPADGEGQGDAKK